MEERDKQKLSLYVPRTVHEALRRIAFEERTSINKLVLEGVEQMLTKRAALGKPKTAKKGA